MSEAVAKNTGRLAVIRIRGLVNVRHDIRKSLELLNLHKKHFCVVVENSASFIGMVKKVKDYVTYGEIDDQTFKLLVEKRGELFKGRMEDSKGKVKYANFITVDGKKYKPFFTLSPPKGGFERKGVKKSFKIGGALGYRGAKINDLIKRMV